MKNLKRFANTNPPITHKHAIWMAMAALGPFSFQAPYKIDPTTRQIKTTIDTINDGTQQQLFFQCDGRILFSVECVRYGPAWKIRNSLGMTIPISFSIESFNSRTKLTSEVIGLSATKTLCDKSTMIKRTGRLGRIP